MGDKLEIIFYVDRVKSTFIFVHPRLIWIFLSPLASTGDTGYALLDSGFIRAKNFNYFFMRLSDGTTFYQGPPTSHPDFHLGQEIRLQL